MMPSRSALTLQPIQWAAGLLLTVLVLVWLNTRSEPNTQTTAGPVYTPKPLVEQALWFKDGPQGEVIVQQSAQGQVVAVIQGEQGFLRQTLRAMARERQRQQLDASQPLLLQQMSNQRLVLNDPQTGLSIDLMAFGASNTAVYSRLLAQTTSATVRE